MNLVQKITLHKLGKHHYFKKTLLNNFVRLKVLTLSYVQQIFFTDFLYSKSTGLHKKWANKHIFGWYIYKNSVMPLEVEQGLENCIAYNILILA